MKKRIKRLNLYHILSFVTGMGMMMFELVAARILAPTIGSSTYIWTSVIGVIIAAMSLGYLVGGKLADMRGRKADLAILNLAVASTVLVALMINGLVLEWISAGRYDLRLQGIVASLVLFAPTSFLMGMISPYLAKLNISSLKTSAQAVASLSSCNAVGSIVGTLLTGFVLFGLMGTRWIMVLVIGMFVVAHWCVEPKKWLRARIGLMVVMAVVVYLTLAGSKKSIEIDTATAHYEVLKVNYGGRPLVALVTTPGGIQSGVYVDTPDELAFWYAKEMAKVVDRTEKRSRILLLGGGAMTLPKYLGQRYPDSVIDVVDIDPELVVIAEKYFGYDSDSLRNVNFIANDARAYVYQTDERYDIVLIDVFNGIDIPWSMTTREFGQSVKGILNEGGVVAMNVVANIRGECRELLGAVSAAYGYSLGGSIYRLRDEGTSMRTNAMVIYGIDTEFGDYRRLDLSSDVRLTDDFAPVEPLQLRCQSF